MISKAFQVGVLTALLAAASTAMAASAELREARLTATGTSAQLTLDVAGRTTQKIFTLDKPRRVVIDLPRTSAVRGLRLPEGSGVVANVRKGHQPGGTLRIVVQLRGPAAARSTWMPETRGGRHQLIINFGDAAPEADTTPRVVRAPHAPFVSVWVVIVAVVAGYGGLDSGATGPGGFFE